MIGIILLVLLVIFLLFSVRFVIKSIFLKKNALEKLKTINTMIVHDWAPEFLETKRMKTDALADFTVETIMAKKEMVMVNHLFRMITDNIEQLPDDAPHELKEYFRKSAELPEWADHYLIDLGQQMYIRHGIWISLLLSYKSLPECYACAKGAEVLHRTARLNQRDGSMDTFSRRIVETAQFVMLAMSPAGLSPQGKGLVATQKVRLIHAVIRYHIRSKDWDPELYGEPINQEDMAGTLMSFSSLILEGLSQMGIEFEPVEKEAYIHCWRVIGHILGLDDDLLPYNSADALKLGYSILDHQIAPSKQGTELMGALLEFQHKKSAMFLGPQTNVDMIRLLMGDKISDLLEVPVSDQTRIDKLRRRIRRVTGFMEIMDKSLVFAMVLQFFVKVATSFMLRRMSPSDLIHFYLPKGLKLDWGFRQKQE